MIGVGTSMVPMPIITEFLSHSEVLSFPSAEV